MSANLGIKIGVEGTAQAEGAMRQMSGAMQGLGAATQKTREEMEMAKRTFESWSANNSALPRLNQQIKDVGISAGQTANAMRMIPMQMTDIVVSLGSGQSPFTVLLQQGGQLKDSFGGVGAALRATAGYVVGLVNPFSVAAAAVGALGLAYYKGSQEADAFNKTIALTGNAVGASANQMAGIAATLGNAFGVTVGQAAEAVNALAATGQVGRASLAQFAKSAIDAEKALGLSLDSIAKNFADLGKDPVGASARLNETMNYLTASTYEQIKAAKDLGQNTKAAALAQNEYDQALKTATNSVVQNLGYIERGWIGIKNIARESWDAMLGVGRPKTITEQLEPIEKNLKAALEKRKTVSDDSAFAPALDKDIEKLKKQLEGLTKIQAAEKSAGDATVARNAANKEGIAAIDAITKANSAALTKQEQMNKALADYRKQLDTLRGTNPNSELLNPAQIAKTEANIREQFKPAAVSTGGESELASLRAKTIEAERYLAALKELGLEADKLTEGERTALRLREELKGTLTAQVRTSKEAALAEAERLGIVQRQIVSEKDLAEQAKKNAAETAKFFDDSIKAQAAAVNAADKSTEAIKKQAMAEREATASIGLTKEAIAELTAAKYDDSAANKERLADIMAEAGEPELLIKKYREEAAALRDLAEAKRERGAAETAEAIRKAEADAAKKATEESRRAAEKAQQEWQRAADKIENSLTDALMRGFEAGKSFAQVLKDTVVNMFKTMILRPQIQGIVSGTLGGLGLGGPGQAAAGGLGGLGDVANMGMNAMGLGGAGALFSSGVSSGLTAWGAGGSVTGLLGQGSALFSGGIASGLGTVAGALGPIVLGIAAIYALSKKLDTSGTIHTGGSASYSATAGIEKNLSQSRTGFAYTNRRAETEDLAAGLTQSIVGLLDSTATAFGKSAGYTAATAFADDTSRDGAWGSLIISKGGKDLLNWADNRQSRWAPKTFGDGEEGVKQYMAAIGKDVRDMLMQETPAWADAMLTALGDSPTLDQLATVVAQINAIQNTFTQFGAAMPQLAKLTDEAVGSLLGLAGGIQNLQSGLAGYYDKFYTEAEKQSAATKRLSDQMATLGLTLPATNAEFRKLVEAQDLTTEAGRRQYASLIALAPAFDQVTAAAEQATQRISQERERLELELLRAQGNTTELRERERNALDASNRALYDQIKAIEDARAAQEAYNQALQSAQSALAAALDRVQSAQSKVDAVREQGTSAYLAALSEVASIQEQIAAETRQTASAYRDLAQQLREYVNGIVVPPSASFAQALTRALGGDREAMASLPGLATSATEQARNQAANREEFAIAQARILSGVLEASAEAQRRGIETPAQAAQTLQQKLVESQGKLAEALSAANAIGAPLAARQDRLIDQYTKALSELATANSEAALARAQLALLVGNTAATATNTGNTAANTATTGALTQEIKALGTIINVGGLVKFDPADPIRSVFDNISKTNTVLNAQFVKWIEITSGSLVTQNTEAGTIAVSAITGFMTDTNRTGGAAGFPGQYVLAYDSTNYLMQIASNTATTSAILNNLAFGQYSMLVRGFGPGQSVPVSFRRDGQSTDYFATGAAFSNGIVTRPTSFNMGMMGEAGPEAIMPLTNVNGTLGIRGQMPGAEGMLQALQTMQMLMQRLQTVGETTALTSQDLLSLLKRLTRDGRAMPVAPSVNDPLTVKVIA